ASCNLYRRYAGAHDQRHCGTDLGPADPQQASTEGAAYSGFRIVLRSGNTRHRESLMASHSTWLGLRASETVQYGCASIPEARRHLRATEASLVTESHEWIGLCRVAGRQQARG